ncbi:cysteine desulfurase family protein [Halolactibacillus alkaliphilus]|uniref:cysteine desulfurase family protein n=1 Tax=Halolactibacillus alkaliphilus TaxID=442899 RepID=UPI0014792E21|nr:aminotransferase class V-fold PLP-dependent enzyme [Halolactibacillus alkaliphilus]
MKQLIYLDHAATTKPLPIVLKTYQDVAKQYFANPASPHHVGEVADDLISQAKTIFTDYFHIPQDGIIFTSGGTESNHLILDLVLHQFNGEPIHIITSTVEHASLYDKCQLLEQQGRLSVTYITPAENGQITKQQLTKAVQPDTKLVTIQLINSETGISQDSEMIGDFCKDHQLLFHTDAVQAFGKQKLSSIFNYVDALSLSAHKIHGLKGVGALLLKQPKEWRAPFQSKTQAGFRQGTIDAGLIASFAVCVNDYITNKNKRLNTLSRLRHYFISQLKHEQLPIEVINSDEEGSHIIGCLSTASYGDYFQQALNRKQIYVSTRSACHSNTIGAIRSLIPLYPTEQHQHYFRISIGYFTTKSEIDATIFALKNSLETRTL